jgi:hypothetical protein
LAKNPDVFLIIIPPLDGPSDLVVIPEVTKGSFVSSDNSSAGSSIKVLKEPWEIQPFFQENHGKKMGKSYRSGWRIFQVWPGWVPLVQVVTLCESWKLWLAGKIPELFRDFVEQEECTGCRTMGNLISSTPQPAVSGKNGDKPWARMSAQRVHSFFF